MNNEILELNDLFPDIFQEIRDKLLGEDVYINSNEIQVTKDANFVIYLDEDVQEDVYLAMTAILDKHNIKDDDLRKKFREFFEEPNDSEDLKNSFSKEESDEILQWLSYLIGDKNISNRLVKYLNKIDFKYKSSKQSSIKFSLDKKITLDGLFYVDTVTANPEYTKLTLKTDIDYYELKLNPVGSFIYAVDLDQLKQFSSSDKRVLYLYIDTRDMSAHVITA